MIEDSEDRVEINGNIRPESEDQDVIQPTEPRKGVMHSWLRDLVISVVQPGVHYSFPLFRQLNHRLIFWL